MTAASCSDEEHPQLQEGNHLIGDAAPPVPYSSSPPTSGWHAGGRPPDPGAYASGMPPSQLVLWLEIGGVAVVYDPERVTDDAARALLELPQTIDDLVVTPYTEAMPTAVALTAWGVLQRCTEVDAAVVQAFVDAHGDDPDPDAGLGY